MTLLFLAIASFLVVVAFVVWLVADTLESRAVRHQRDVASVQPFLLSISEAFDPIHSILWQAAIAGANRLARQIGRSRNEVAPNLRRAAHRFREIDEGHGFLSWLQFLEDTRLISWDDRNVALTPVGHAFLRFRFETDALVET